MLGSKAGPSTILGGFAVLREWQLPTGDRRSRDRADTGADRRALMSAIGTICSVFAVGAAAQASWAYSELTPRGVATEFAARAASNLVGVAVDLGVLRMLRIEVRRGAARWGEAVFVAAAVAAGVRVGAQVLFAVYLVATPGARLIELASWFSVTLTANLLGMAFLHSRQRVRHEAHVAAAGEVRYRTALDALEGEEIRVRRDVAEGLHGGLQQHLVLLTTRLAALADRLDVGAPTTDDSAALREIVARLDKVRETDVREISRMLYPDALEIGLVPAVRSLLVKLPTSIATSLRVSDAVRLLDDPAAPSIPQGDRLLAVRVVEEAVTNALRHGAATQIEVRLDEGGGLLTVEVQDNGCGFDVELVSRSGTARLGDRLVMAGGQLELRSTVGGGTVLAAALRFMPTAAPGVARPFG